MIDHTSVLVSIRLPRSRPSREGLATAEFLIWGSSKTLKIPKLYSHFLSYISLPNFVPAPDLCTSFSIHTLVLVGISWWGNIWSNSGSLHPCGLAGFLSLVYCSTVLCHVLKKTHFLLSRWHSSNLCSMPNLVFGWRILPTHYLMFAAHLGFCWKLLPRWGLLRRMFRYNPG